MAKLKVMSREERFQHLILMGIWFLILASVGKINRKLAYDFQSSAIAFGDEYGNQSEGAAKYRREEIYQNLP